MELRRFRRAPLNGPVLYSRKEAPKDDDAYNEGTAVDISLGGMFVAAEAPAAFGSEITIQLTIDAEQLVVPATVRWTRSDGMGVQFGLLGVRETFLITEVVRRFEEARG